MNRFCGNCFNETLNEQGICTLCGFDAQANRQIAPHALPAGTILNGRYIIGRVLGQGGFGITYTAKDHQTGQVVAVKEFFPDSMAMRSSMTEVTPFQGERGENFAYGRETFLQEAQTMAEFIGNPNIVRVYSYFEENGTAYFAMEYVDGESYLAYLKARGGKIPVAEALKILYPVMDALSAVHEKNIIHRDVTPDNIYISKNGTVKLLDFGAARYSLGNASRSLDVILKHGFAPREQYKRRGRQGPYTDVYSLGATLYYSITGIRPDDALERVDEDTVVLPGTMGVKISREQETVMMKAMAVDPEDRYQTMAEFRRALSGAKPAQKDAPAKKETASPKPQKSKAEKKTSSKPVRTGRKPAPKALWAVAAAALVLVCIGAVSLLVSREKPALSADPTRQPTAAAATEATPDEVLPLTPEEIAYNEAVDLFYQEEYGKAAIAFGKLGDFRDAREISFKIWDAIAVRNTFSTGNTDAVAIKNNGAVISTSPGRNTRICESDNIISVRAAGSSVAIGLKADGTVVLDKPEWYHLSVDISDWNNIVSVSLDDWHVVGLRADGTVVAAGWYEETDDTHVGMCDVSDWTDIIAVEAGNGFTVALKADGTVIKTGDDIQGVYEISKWTDVVAIDAGWNHIVALKEDGTVVAVGLDSTGECDVSDWTDIVSICAGDDHTIGIKADGTVVGVGHKGERRYKVTDWKNITAVSIGWNILAGLQSDGTVVTAGRSRDMINNWQDIKLPADRDALLSRIKPQHISPEKVPDPVPAGLSAEETAYNEAVDLFYQEEYGKAAIAFGKLGDFRDAREISFKIWDAIAKRQTILADVACTMAIKEDGTVIACGAEAPEDMSEWKDIVSVASPPIGSYFPKAALRSDGRVMVYNTRTGSHIIDRDGWTDIVAIECVGYHLVGLRSDGTLVSTSREFPNPDYWVKEEEETEYLGKIAFLTDIVEFGEDLVKYVDGTVMVDFEVSDHKDIIARATCHEGSAWLRRDGTVFFEYSSEYNKTSLDKQMDKDLSSWTDIVSISGSGSSQFLGLKSDGTVVATGKNDYHQLDVEEWTDIAAINSGWYYSAGLKKDGTLVAAGSSKGDALKPIRSWTGLKVPADREALLAQIRPRYITASAPRAEVQNPDVDISQNILMGLGVSDLELSRISTRSEAKKLIPEYEIFNLSIKRKEVRTVTFLDTLKDAPANAVDASALGDNKVKAWATKNGELYDVFVGAEGGIMAPEDCSWLFGFLPNLTELNFNDAFDTSNVTSMLRMFDTCGSLKKLDLSSFDTSNVNMMSGMFIDCSELEEVDVTSFNTKNVSNMSGMFSMCKNLHILNLTGFDTSGVISMESMFLWCESLKKLDLSNFDVTNVTSAFNMFRKCPAPKPDWYDYTMD